MCHVNTQTPNSSVGSSPEAGSVHSISFFLSGSTDPK